jgi:hypothetical protein
MKDKQEVWKEIAAKNGIDEKMFEYTTFEFVGTVFLLTILSDLLL